MEHGDEAYKPDTLAIALRYAQAGLKVLPLHSARKGKCSCAKEGCESIGKHPRLPNGAHGASSDPAIITAWIKKWPACNIGITLEGFVVIDVDPRHNGDETLDALIAVNGRLPDTATQATGGGGRHFMFRANPKAHYRGGLGAGVDLKHGGGAYIVVEPSLHASGNRYAWLDEEGPHEGGTIADAPSWIWGNATLPGGNVLPGPGADKIPIGGRNSFLYERCRRMRDMSFRQDEILAAALAINQARFLIPLSPDEVHTIAKSAALNEPEVKIGAQFIDAAEFVANIPPPQWLIDGVVQRSYLYGLTAPTNHGKTALAALMALCVGLGKDFAGQACEAGHVLYLAGENPEDFKLRLRGACQANGVPVADMATRITIMPVVDKLTAFIDDIKTLAESKPLALILIDTSVAYFSYGDENANVDNRQHAQDMRALIGASGAPAVLALCHPVKNAAEDNLSPRGGSAFLNELDCNLTLYKQGEVCDLSHNKLRGPPFQSIQFKLMPCVINGVLDSKGREVNTVIMAHMSETEAEGEIDKANSDARVMLLAIKSCVKPSLSAFARYAEWFFADMRPDKSRAQRTVKMLIDGKYAAKEFRRFVLTEKGRNYIK